MAVSDTHATKGGKVDLGSGKAQHVDLFRKLRLRRELLADAEPGAAFVPFLGEGDIALELYRDREILGIELDDAIAVATSRRFVDAGLSSKVITGDANVWHPNAWGPGHPFAVADLDAFSNPYHSLAALWTNGQLADRVVIFGTDGLRLGVKISTTKHLGPLPDAKIVRADMATRRRQFNNYWTAYVRPYLVDLVAPGQIVRELKYQRQHMLYWGIVVDRAAGAAVGAKRKRGPSSPRNASRVDPERARLLAEIAQLFGLVPVGAQPSAAAANDATPAQIAKVENALLEAAESGNVPAAIFWLEHKGGERWRKAAAATSTASDMLAELTGRKP